MAKAGRSEGKELARQASKTTARAAARRIGRRGDDPPILIPQNAEVVERQEYHLRILQTVEREVTVFASDHNIAQELGNNGLGRVISERLVYSETKSVSQIG